MLNQDEGGKDATKQQRNSKNRIRVKEKTQHTMMSSMLLKQKFGTRIREK